MFEAGFLLLAIEDVVAQPLDQNLKSRSFFWVAKLLTLACEEKLVFKREC